MESLTKVTYVELGETKIKKGHIVKEDELFIYLDTKINTFAIRKRNIESLKTLKGEENGKGNAGQISE
jgi:hypothetical protein